MKQRVPQVTQANVANPIPWKAIMAIPAILLYPRNLCYRPIMDPYRRKCLVPDIDATRCVDEVYQVMELWLQRSNHISGALIDLS